MEDIKSVPLLEIANTIIGGNVNHFEVVSHSENLVFIITAPLSEYFHGARAIPQGESIFAIYRSSVISTGYFDIARNKPIRFLGESFCKDPDDDPFSQALEHSHAAHLRPVSFTGDSAEAMLMAFADAYSLKAYWERKQPRQYGVDVTYSIPSDQSRIAVCLQPKMTQAHPYTRNDGWIPEYNRFTQHQQNLSRYNSIVRNSDEKDYIAVSDAEISPDTIRKLTKHAIGYIYLHAYRAD